MNVMNILFVSLIMLSAIAAPLIVIYRRAKSGKRGKAPLIINLCSFFGLTFTAAVFLFAQSASATGGAAAEAAQGGMTYLAAALAVGLSGIGGGIAVSASASAALGALSENDSLFGKALIFVGMAEGVALYGLLIAFMILMG